MSTDKILYIYIALIHTQLRVDVFSSVLSQSSIGWKYNIPVVNLRSVHVDDNVLVELPRGSSNNYYKPKGSHGQTFGESLN